MWSCFNPPAPLRDTGQDAQASGRTRRYAVGEAHAFGIMHPVIEFVLDHNVCKHNQHFSSMDPMSLLHILVGVLASVREQYERFSILKDDQRNSLARFKHVSEVLKEDLTLYKSLFEAFVHHGNSEGLSKLLRTKDGNKAYNGLGSALERVNELLKMSDHTVTAQAAGLATTRTRFETIVAPIVLADAVETTTESIDNTTSQLAKCQVDIARAFKYFYTLYLLHDAPPSTSPEFYANTREDLNALDALVSSFHRRPFGVCSTGDGAPNVDQLCLLNKDQETAARHTKLMVDAGRNWVDDQLMEVNSVNILSLVQTRLMEFLWSCSLEQLKDESLELSSDLESDKMEVGVDLRVLEASLKSAIARARQQKFTIAFCGMVKAGKSLFLNSLMGRTILPSDELPSTAWPCRLRHNKGQKVPKLSFDPKPFHQGLLQLQRLKFGLKMKSYTPPTVDPFASILSDSDSASVTTIASADEDLAWIYRCWSGLHQNTRQNLLRFEDPEFQLLAQVEGDVLVRNLLSEINDIVRLCHRFRLGFKMDDVDWPLLIVEFDSLRDQDIEGVFEFIDLPGLGEGFEDYDFEELIRRVAKDTHAVVPILNFKEIPKEDWKRLPDIISSGPGVRTDFVVCTHFDQINPNNLPEQRANVAKVFWPNNPGFTERIIPCSSLLGLGAFTLLRRSTREKPELSSFWNPEKIEYHCAEKILGTGNTEGNFASFDLEKWRKACKVQLKRSGLEDALHRLSTDMVARARQRVLIIEGRQLWIQLHKLANGQRRLLLNFRRTEAEFERAEQKFKSAQGEFISALKKWEGEEAKRSQDYEEKLRRGLDVLDTAGIDAVAKAMRSTMDEWGHPVSHSSSNFPAISSLDSSLQPAKSSGKNIGHVPKVLTVDSQAAAEDFFHESQKKLTHLLTELRRQFVSTIRTLADRARQERFENLTKAIKSLDETLEPELQDEILVDLDAKAVNIQSLAFRKVRRNLKTETIRYGPKAAFQAIETSITKRIPLIRSNEDSDEENPHKVVEDLGFMLRAPIAVIATVPFVLGAGIWPLVTQSKKYHLDPDVIGKRYVEKIVNPFLRDLKSEGQMSLHETMKRSSNISRAAVVGALKRENDRYEKERTEKQTPPPKEHVAQLVAIHSSFVAAEAAFKRLREHLDKFV